MTDRLKDLFIREMLNKFDWLTESDLWHFEDMYDTDHDYYISPEYDNGYFYDIRYIHNGYTTTLLSDPDFCIWEELENGNYVAEAV